MEPFFDSELEFLRREIAKKYTVQATEANDIIKEIPECPKSVGDEKFNFLSEYVEKELKRVYKNSSPRIRELDDFGKDNIYHEHTLSATLKKLYCEQHYKKPIAQRKTEQFKLKSINRFYFYISGKKREEYWKSLGITDIGRSLDYIQNEIDAYQLPLQATDVEEQEQMVATQALSQHAYRPIYRSKWIIAGLFSFLAIALGYILVLQTRLQKSDNALGFYSNKIVRTPTPANQLSGIMGKWVSYNRTPETNDANRKKGLIYRGVNWNIDSSDNGVMYFSRSTEVNENDGWVELLNMQVNFFVNVHPKITDKNKPQSFGFCHFVCKPNKVDLKDADTLWCACTSFVHKDGRLDDPLASREILIRDKGNKSYAIGVLPPDSLPKQVRDWLQENKSYLRAQP